MFTTYLLHCKKKSDYIHNRLMVFKNFLFDEYKLKKEAFLQHLIKNKRIEIMITYKSDSP